MVTGEGRADWQSAFGKVMSGVGMRAKKNGIPAVGLCGSLGKGAIDIFDFGIDSLMTTVNAPMTLDFALDNAEALYYEAAVRMFRLIQVGMRIMKKQRLLPYRQAVPSILLFQIISSLALQIWMSCFSLISRLLIRSTGHVAVTSGDFSFLFTTWQGILLIILAIVNLFLFVAVFR